MDGLELSRRVRAATPELPIVILTGQGTLDAAVDGAMLGLYLNQGQCCCAGSRLFVEDSVYDRMVERLAERTGRRKLGDPFDPETEQGPQVDRTQFDRVMGFMPR